MKTVIVFLFLVTLAANLFAPSLEGMVVDNQKNPIEGAYIILVRTGQDCLRTSHLLDSNQFN